MPSMWRIIFLTIALALTFWEGYAKGETSSWQSAKVIALQESSSDRTLPLYQAIEKHKDHLKTQVNTQGVSRNLLVADREGNLIAVFRNHTITGEAEYRVFLLDSDGFFQFPAVLEVTLQIDGLLHQGYIQEFIPLPANPPASERTPFRQQIQRLGILDIMLANADRHDGNILIHNGQLVPIDHNLSLVGTLEGFQISPFLTQGPEAQQIIPIPRVMPIWLSEKRFSQFAQQPFDPETLKYIQQINIEELLKSLKSTGLSESRLRLIGLLIKWLKQGAASGLTLDQLGKSVFASYSFDTATKLARREGYPGIDRISRLEYDLHRAAMIMQEQEISWDQAVDIVFKERILILKGQQQEFPKEILLNLIDWSSHPRLGKLTPANRLIVKALARRLTDIKAHCDGGFDWRTTSQIYRDYLYTLADTYGNIQTGKENADTGSLFVDFLLLMATHSDTLMLKGEVWNEQLLKLMFALPLEEVKAVIQTAKDRSQAETALYQEPLGQEWQSFAIPKFVEQRLREVKK